MKIIWEWRTIFWSWGWGKISGWSKEEGNYEYKEFTMGPLSIRWKE